MAEERKVIEDIHAYIGWYIQTQVEMGKNNGAIERDDLKKLLRAHLADREDRAEHCRLALVDVGMAVTTPQGIDEGLIASAYRRPRCS